MADSTGGEPSLLAGGDAEPAAGRPAALARVLAAVTTGDATDWPAVDALLTAAGLPALCEREQCQLSRWMTLAAGLKRLKLLEGDRKELRLILLGAESADGGNTAAALLASLTPLLHAIASCSVRVCRLFAVGPRLPARLKELTAECTVLRMGASLQLMRGCLHELSEDEIEQMRAADLAVAYNAGIWGYDSWPPSIALLLQRMRVPLLWTSYNEAEADDDVDTVKEAVPDAVWLWEMEENSWSSPVSRRCEAYEGSLTENAFSSCCLALPAVEDGATDGCHEDADESAGEGASGEGGKAEEAED
eukprot:PLAT2005.1.p1 GENE.PLAT2005.1~~PLAT2005.1.p1  ORF type:complete len:329 (+),score=72.99 PLAT2005.1:73-987(+)